ncbi:AidA/PixA family protein [Xenorhabdus innexi]|uniref:Inclusion body protein n=1 Tax=Xenorhabdus innexi TaxID=290109 RepID=A0A1N6MXY4_9GAMM|nr:AidA/PixA family protein [Xenorhabdus innexi]PHM30290.1 hypothetical protein Xinn_03356 [Xenorhabdus innexi]SIP73579.1 hypothetical protein XIS1_380002 [Xenorhabdus innexi]
MSDFNLFIVLDIEGIISKNEYSGTKKSPAMISEDFIHILLIDQGKNELLDKKGITLMLDDVKRGDVINWSIINLPNYQDSYSALLYKYEREKKNPQVMSDPKLTVRTIKLPYILSDSNTDNIETKEIKENFWSSRVMVLDKKVGEENYYGFFTIYDSKGEVIGYSKFNNHLILNPVDNK